MSKKQIEKAVQKMVQEANPYAGREGLVYVRVSSKRQELEGHGRTSQEERCKQYLQSIGVPYAHTFPDTFTGGGDFMKRPAMRGLLGCVDAHPHKKYVVVFDDLKRFARDTTFHLKLRTELKVRDVLPRCLNYNFDDSPEGMFVETVLAAGNELERHQNRRQVIQKMKARLDLGYWPFAGRRGYDMKKNPLHGKIHVANKDSRIMKEALEGFAAGNLVRKVDVARFLHKRKFWKTKRAPEYFIDDVTKMLMDVFQAGYIEYEPWGVKRRKGHHKGIITLDTYELIQKRLKKEDSKSRVRMDVSPEFPLRGVTLCPACSQKLTGAPCKGRSKTYLYYYCVTKECPLRSKMLSKKDVERDFSVLLRRNRLKDEMGELVQLTFDRSWKQEVVDLKRQETLKEQHRKELEEKLRELSELSRTTRSDLVRRTYEQQMEATAKELERGGPNGTKRDLGVPYRTALAKSTGMLKNPITIWEKVDVVEKHRLYFFLFEARLPYTKGEGFRTGELLSSTRIFEEFCDENSVDVDPTGFEPVTSSLQTRRSTN
jgi:site-specific DNA recombinase